MGKKIRVAVKKNLEVLTDEVIKSKVIGADRRVLSIVFNPTTKRLKIVYRDS